MSTNTAIQWTDVTDNILVCMSGGWWCRMISPGCANCYAAKLNQSAFFGGNKLPYTGKPPPMRLRDSILFGWARMRTPKKHFVASMTDIFGEWVSDDAICAFLTAMQKAPIQTFQLLTKRPQRAWDGIQLWLNANGLKTLPDNIWIGVSVEDQQRADERIPILLNIPAKVRFLSVEPMLEEIDLKRCETITQDHSYNGGSEVHRLAWVIVGGESGRNARPCNVAWIRSIVEQCKAAGVACFVKQLGSRPFSEGRIRCEWGMKHPKGGDPSEWPSDLKIRQFPTL